MRHILDYKILKEWGFVWSTKRTIAGVEYCTSYFKEKTDETDAHGFRSITLMMLPHPNYNAQWIMSYLDSKSQFDVLFRGRIADKYALNKILKSCIVFKPKKSKKR